MTPSSKLSFILACITIAFTTLAYGGVHQPVIAIFYVLSALMLMLWAVDAMQGGTVKLDRSPFQLLLLAGAIYGFIQVIPFSYNSDTGIQAVPNTISADPFTTLTTSIHAIALLIFFSTLLTLLDSTNRIRNLVNYLTVFGFVFAFFAILQSILSPAKIYGIYEVRYARPFGSFVNRHNFAALIEMIIALPLAFLLTGLIKRDRRLLYVTMTSLMGVALILSGSRGGFVSLIALVAMMVIVTRKSSGRRDLILRAGLAVGLILVVIAGSILVGGESSLSRFVETAKSQDVTTSRAHIWETTHKDIDANLPFGVGLGALGVAYTPFDTLSGMERVEQAHNDYLQLASDMGIFGILLGCVFLFLFFRTGTRATRVENPFRRAVSIGAFCGCFAVVVHSMFDFVLHTTAIALVFISLLSLVIAAEKPYIEEERVHRKPRRTSHRKNVAPLAQFPN
jgi:O-antigen ligase